MRTLPDEEQAGGAGGQSTYEGLLKCDAGWTALREGTLPPPREIVTEEFAAPEEQPEFDVAVVGGTIGVLVAAALQLRGLRLVLVEAGTLIGRAQDWNASRKEVEELLELGVLTAEDLADVIGIEFNPMRCGFVGGEDVWLRDVLNVGVRPAVLIQKASERFVAAGGTLREEAALRGIAIRPGAAVLSTADGGTLRARLVLDAMGQRSPIVAQVRRGARPDGACIVVGSCARGYPAEANTFGDVIYSDVPQGAAGKDGCPTQYFWEAFPSSSGPTDRTTYLFTYLDLDLSRPSVQDIMEDYWELLPKYQGVPVDSLQLRRVLCSLFLLPRPRPRPHPPALPTMAGASSSVSSSSRVLVLILTLLPSLIWQARPLRPLRLVHRLAAAAWL